MCSHGHGPRGAPTAGLLGRESPRPGLVAQVPTVLLSVCVQIMPILGVLMRSHQVRNGLNGEDWHL